jgi:hypothetical protein
VSTVTDLIHDVIGYLVTQCQQNPALGAAPLNPVLIIDGPTGAGEPLTQQQILWIGFDAVTGNADDAVATQKFAFLGTSGGYRDEDGSITCTAQAWSGDPAPVPARAQCKAIVGAVEVMLRGAPTLGPGDSSMGGLVQWSQIEDLAWFQWQDGTGYSAMCVFKITYFARLQP